MKMLRKTIMSVAVVSALGASPVALAGIEYHAGVERFEWTETAPGGGRLLKESGPRFVFGSAAEQNKTEGLLFGGRGRVFFGGVDYDGQTWGGTPVSTDTNYLGGDFQGRVMWRIPRDGYRADLFGALGYRLWVRDLESTNTAQGYVEFWRMPYAGVGAALSRPDGRGFYGEALLGKPFSVRNKAFLANAGFDGDVTLKPDGKLLLRIEAGYRWAPWFVSAYYEQVRFDVSPVEMASIGGTPVPVFQPESKESTLGLKVGYRY